jgi:hypothetical protein
MGRAACDAAYGPLFSLHSLQYPNALEDNAHALPYYRSKYDSTTKLTSSTPFSVLSCFCTLQARTCVMPTIWIASVATATAAAPVAVSVSGTTQADKYIRATQLETQMMSACVNPVINPFGCSCDGDQHTRRAAVVLTSHAPTHARVIAMYLSTQ